MPFRLLIAAVGLSFLLAACGSSPPSGVDTLRQAVQSYNATHPTDLASTGAACRQSYRELRAGTRPSNSALRGAYRDLLAAYHDCVLAAEALDYAAAVRAQAEIAAANAAIIRARRA
ncbi:MAG TPA: hypothetical protein VFB58_08510 [Chloroflexota bacterium]|nr:hypothetical protein [Chloroflexota bacterium]